MGDSIKPAANNLVPAGNTIKVNSTAGYFNSGDGLCTLPEAIWSANNNAVSGPVAGECTAGSSGGSDTIDMTGISGVISLDSALPQLTSDMSINGPGFSSLTIQRSTAQGTTDFRIFRVLDPSPRTISFSGLSIANGLAPKEGAGISNGSTATVNITNCRLTGNVVGPGPVPGGAVYNSGTLNMSDSTLDLNTSSFEFGNNASGGGLFNSGVATLTHVAITQNVAYYGGAVANTGTLVINNSNIYVNRGTVGSGIYSNGGSVTITDSTISGNSGSAGIYEEGGATVRLSNSTVSGNIGGAIRTVSGEQVYLVNATIVNNTGADNQVHASLVQLRNTIVGHSPAFANTGPDVSGIITSQGHNLISDGGSVFPAGNPNGNSDIVGTTAAPIDPVVGSVSNNGGQNTTVALLPGSPAINAGDNCVTQATHCGDANTPQIVNDERGPGFSRIVNGTVDIGAFESRGFNIAVVSGSGQSAQINSAFAAPLVAGVSSPDPVNGGLITFTSPASGPSATFTGGVKTFLVTVNASGQASASATTNQIAGSYAVTATANGSSTSASFNLTNNPAPTHTDVTSSVNPSPFGQSVTFTATVTSFGGTPSGTLQFKDNGTNLGPAMTLNVGVAQVTTSTLTPGTHTIETVYSGNANFIASGGILPGGQVVKNRSLFKFSQSNYSVNENGGSVTITVNRLGDLAPALTVDYATPDDSGAPTVLPCSNTNGVASPRCDFATGMGTLRFASGDTSKTFVVLISQDSFVEGNETLTLTLSNPTGGAGFAQPSDASATLTIVDDDSSPPSTNPIDDPTNFVREHYHDFLNREPDASGLAFWTGQITSCGNDQQCIDTKRINASAAFFLAIEFQQTGFLVERFYKVGYGDAVGNSKFQAPHQLFVPIVRFSEFLRDMHRIGDGVVVLQPGWEQVLENNKQAYALEFVQTSRFVNALPTSLRPDQFVDRLNQNAGGALSLSERSAVINLFGGAADTTNITARAQAVRQVADDADLVSAESNRAFVLAEYFGYLRRNPNDAPETTLDYSGYDFWLTKLNQFNGNYLQAEMVKAFLTSFEYRQRFGP